MYGHASKNSKDISTTIKAYMFLVINDINLLFLFHFREKKSSEDKTGITIAPRKAWYVHVALSGVSKSHFVLYLRFFFLSLSRLVVNFEPNIIAQNRERIDHAQGTSPLP